MIRITCCRMGRFPRSNKESKGTFIKEFDNMQQLALFVKHSWKSLYFPYANKELTKHQRFELMNKINSLRQNKK